MAEEIPEVSGQDSLHGHGIENASGFTQPKADQEHRLVARLMRSGQWIIPERIYKSGPEILAVIAEDETAEPKERNGALRSLIMMGNANTGQASVEVRVNQAIAIEVAPEAPADVNLDVQPAWAEIVNTDSMQATVDVFIGLQHMERYIEQCKNSPPPLPSNGNGGLN